MVAATALDWLPPFESRSRRSAKLTILGLWAFFLAIETRTPHDSKRGTRRRGRIGEMQLGRITVGGGGESQNDRVQRVILWGLGFTSGAVWLAGNSICH